MPLPSTIRTTCPTHLILLEFITHTILGEQYRSLSSSLCSFLQAFSHVTFVYTFRNYRVQYTSSFKIRINTYNLRNVHYQECNIEVCLNIKCLSDTMLHYIIVHLSSFCAHCQSVATFNASRLSILRCQT